MPDPKEIEPTPPPEPQPGAHECFSLDQRIPQPPFPSQQSERLIWWCRVIVWLSPGPACLLVGSGLGQLGFSHITILFAALILCSFGAGCCDAFLSPSVCKQDGKPETKAMLWHAFAFSCLQIVIAPLVTIALAMFLLVFADSI